MHLSFSADTPTLSARLYAEGFSLPLTEAEADLDTLIAGGAIPLTLAGDGQVLSQGIGIPIDTGDGPILYLYALTTDRAARGQGLLRTLLRECADAARARGFSALCLLPASAALADAYRRMGFTEALPVGGAPHIESATDLALRLDEGARPITPKERHELYRAMGQTMPEALFDFTLSTLAPAVLPMRTDEGYALALASDPRYALAASYEAVRVANHTLLAAPLGGRLPIGIYEPLPR